MDHVVEIELRNRDTYDTCDLSDCVIDDDEECCICLNTLDNVYVVLDCCKKQLHKQCLISWMCYGNYIELRCPMCRVEISNITELVSYNDIMDNTDVQLNDNVMNIIERYYSNDGMYIRQMARLRQRENYLMYIDRTLIISILIWLIVLTSCLILLVIINRN